MKHLAKKLFSILPENTRHHIIRKMASVPQQAWDHGYTVEIAHSKEDLEQAYALLHDCYVGTKIMKPNSSKLRCNWYSLLPQTTLVVTKYNNQVVGTVSIIKDSHQGIPSDNEFKIENDNIRRASNSLAEISALAVDKKFRDSNHTVSLLLMKYLFNYCEVYLKTTRLICTVHPRAEDFYRSLWHFERNGKVVQYQFVEGALAVHLSMEISAEKTKKIVSSYRSNDLNKNLALFVLNIDPRFKFPLRKQGQVLDPVMTPELLQYFFTEKTQLLKELSNEKISYFYEMYKQIYSHEAIVALIGRPPEVVHIKAYRVPIEITGIASSKEQTTFVKILDLTPEGCFISLPEQPNLFSNDFILQFNLGSKSYQIESRMVWINNGTVLSHPRGIGVQFKKTAKGISQHLSNLMAVDNMDYSSEMAQSMTAIKKLG